MAALKAIPIAALALAVLGWALMAAPPSPASAALYSGTLTAASYNSGIQIGFRDVGTPNGGTLSPSTFAFGGTDYRIHVLEDRTDQDRDLIMQVNGDVGAALDALVLTIGSRSYNLSDASRQSVANGARTRYDWSNLSPLPIPSAGNYSVSLSEPPTPTPTNTPTPTPVPPPSAPTGLTATAGSYNLTLSWNNPGNPTITRYEYRYPCGSGSFAAIPGSSASTTSYTVVNLPIASACVEIRAVNAVAVGASAQASATPLIPTPTPTPEPLIPTIRDPGNHFFHGADFALVLAVVVAVIAGGFTKHPGVGLGLSFLVLAIASLLGHISPLTITWMVITAVAAPIFFKVL